MISRGELFRTLPAPGWGEDSVAVPAEYFRDGRFPPVCAVTGRPATSNLARRFTTTPGWVGWLLLANWFAFFIAALASRRTAIGRVPVVSAVAVRVQRWHMLAVWLAAAGVMAWVTTVVVSIAAPLNAVGGAVAIAFAGAGLLALIGSAVASSAEARAAGIQGRVVDDGFGQRWVQLRHVHPAFVRALASSLRLPD